MRRFLFPCLFLVACGTSEEVASSSNAAIRAPAYRFELKARGSEDPEISAFGVPSGVYIKDITPSLNDRGDMSLDFGDAKDIVHVWKNGAIIHVVPDPKAVVAGTSLDEAGNVAFDVMGGETGNGIFRHDAATQATSFFSSEPLGAESWLDVKLLDDGRVGCRAGGGGHHFIGYVDPDGFRKVAVETASNPNSPYEYIYSPAWNRQGNVAVKVMLASGGEEIRWFAQGAAPVTLAQDVKANPSSPMTSIDNGVALSGDGDIAFVAKVAGKRAVYRVSHGTTTRIATEGENEVAQVAFFTPALDPAGRVVFKGEDTQRRNTIWVGNGDRLDRLVTAGDSLPTDQGEALALPETEADPQNRVAFGGGVVMNARGAIVFSAALAQNGARIGTGIYLATPSR